MAPEIVFASCPFFPLLRIYGGAAQPSSRVVLGLFGALVYCPVLLGGYSHVGRSGGTGSGRWPYPRTAHRIWVVPASGGRFRLAVQLDEPAHVRSAMDGAVIFLAVAPERVRQFRRNGERDV